MFRRDPDRTTRRATDGLRLAFGAVVLGALALHDGHESATERAIVNLAESFPAGLRTPLLALYGLAALWAVGLLLAALFVGRRWRLARDIGIAAATSWVTGRVLGSLVRDGGLGRALHTLVHLGSTPRFPLTRVAVVTAAVTVASPHLARPIRRIGQALVAALTIAALFLATAFPGDLLGAISLGWAVAALVHLAFGIPVGKPTAEQVTSALARLRLAVHELRRAHDQPDGATIFKGVDATGPVRVAVLGRDDVDAQVLAKLWRYAAYRHEGSVFFLTRRQRVEHEAYATLVAREAGARVADVLAAGAADPRLALLAVRALPGRPLATLPGYAVDDTLLRRVWEHVAAIHHAGLAHGRLGAATVVVDGNEPAIVDFADATTTATAHQRAADVAELLAATSAIVGPERATTAALGALDPDAVAAALPLLQPGALTEPTRSAFGDAKALAGRLERLRGVAAGATGHDVPELQPLVRVRPRTIAMWVGTLVAIVVLFSQVGNPSTFWNTIKDANWLYVGLAFAAALATNAAFALAFLGTVPMPLPFWPTAWLQVAMGFSNVALPAGAESAVQVRFLQKQGVDLAAALAVGGVLSTISELVIQLGLFGIALLLAPGKVDIGRVPVGSMAAVALVGVLVVGVIGAIGFGIRRIRHKVLPHVQRAARAIWDAIRTPSRIAMMLVGNVVAQALYAGALLASLHAFGQGASFWTLLALNIGISTVAGLVPVPGGDTAVSTIGMSGALVAVGVPQAAAAAAVVTNTLVTSYLPAIPGWFATRYLVGRDLL